jgi:hypothetical protein
MLSLQNGEKIVSLFRPALQEFSHRPGHCCDHGQCGRVPLRVIVIQSNEGERSVALCGIHFVHAVQQYPQLYEIRARRAAC